MKLADPTTLVLHRVGGLDITNRFKPGQMPVISEGDWKATAPVQHVTFSSGTLLESEVVVREMVPRSGDVTGRRYTEADGVNAWVDLPAYGVVDPEKYLDFVRENVPGHISEFAATRSNAHREALRLMRSGDAPEFKALLCYDFGRLQKTRSAFLTGPVNLGIQPLPETAQTLPGLRPLPRMITAQCDAVVDLYLDEMLVALFGEQGNGPLTKRILSNDPADTHIAYVALSILTEGTIWVLTDKERRDLENNNADHSLQIQLEENLNRLIKAFSGVHYGMDFGSVKADLPSEALAFYKAAQAPAVHPAAPEPWKDTFYWLPALETVLTQTFEEKRAFAST